jgi:hypothetical protein
VSQNRRVTARTKDTSGLSTRPGRVTWQPCVGSCTKVAAPSSSDGLSPVFCTKCGVGHRVSTSMGGPRVPFAACCQRLQKSQPKSARTRLAFGANSCSLRHLVRLFSSGAGVNLDLLRLSTIRLPNYPTIRLSDYPTIQLSDYPTIRLSDYPTNDYPTIRLPNYPTIRLSDYPTNDYPTTRLSD